MSLLVSWTILVKHFTGGLQQLQVARVAFPAADAVQVAQGTKPEIYNIQIIRIKLTSKQNISFE